MKPLCPLCKSKSALKNTRYEYNYYYCKICATLFLRPKPNKKQLDKYYKESFQYSAGGTNERPMRERAHKILKKLVSLNPRGSKLLDIGSGYGYFLDDAGKIGLKVTGIEPNSSLASDSINKLIKSLHNKTFEQFFLRNSRSKYDFITLIHVIEHVSNPKKIIQMACQLLSLHGILYIETPNLDSHLYRAEQNNYTFLTPPDHLWIFSRKSFEEMIDKDYFFKFLSTYSYPEHFMGILKARAHIQPSRLEVGCQDNPLSLKKRKFDVSYIKYLLFDKCIACLFYPLLNLKYYGSILELYIKKK